MLRLSSRFRGLGGKTRAFAVGLTVVLVCASVASAATYAPVVIRLGNLVVKVKGGLTPANLPKTNPVPIEASIEGTVRTTDGSHVPSAEKITVDIDKNFTIN